MKQNERLLVYAVTGFLAIILLVAVLFGPNGRDAAAKSGTGDATNGKNDAPRGLGELLGNSAVGNGAAGTGAKPATETESAGAKTTPPAPPATTGTVADVLQPNPVTTQQPLVANERPLVAMEIVAQQLGASRRDRDTRMVRARAGDSLEKLVQRWCGAVHPFLEETKALNEDLVTLRVGQEICVPWVDDEVVLAAYEATKPKTLTPSPSAVTPTTDPNVAGQPVAPPRPAFAEPGVARPDNVGRPTNVPAATGSGTEYVVKSGDSLWKIADRTYGRQNAPKMIGEIKRANPSIGDTLRAGQTIVLPAAK